MFRASFARICPFFEAHGQNHRLRASSRKQRRWKQTRRGFMRLWAHRHVETAVHGLVSRVDPCHRSRFLRRSLIPTLTQRPQWIRTPDQTPCWSASLREHSSLSTVSPVSRRCLSTACQSQRARQRDTRTRMKSGTKNGYDARRISPVT